MIDRDQGYEGPTDYEEQDGRDASPITQAVQMLDKEGVALADLVEVLAGRLSPVLSPSETVPMRGGAEEGPEQPILRAGLTQHLVQSGHVLRDARMRLDAIIDRLEV